MFVGRATVGPVRIAWADSAGPDLPDVSILRGLGAAQAQRYARLQDVRAARFLTGRWLMMQLLAELSERAATEISTVCERCGGDHGAPTAAEAPVSLSVSYAGSMVSVAAVHDADASAVGIDIETESSAGPLDELARLFAPEPPPDLRGWTLIEAVLKADGRGLRVPPATVSFRGREGRMIRGAHRMSVPGRTDAIEASAAPGPTGYVLSVAVAPVG